jgi:hypothetical protein
VKKVLSQRWHVFSDGTCVQRDLYATWLARFFEDDRLDVSRCYAHWGMRNRLSTSGSSPSQSAIGQRFPLANAGTPPRQRQRAERRSGSLVKDLMGRQALGPLKIPLPKHVSEAAAPAQVARRSRGIGEREAIGKLCEPVHKLGTEAGEQRSPKFLVNRGCRE